MNWLLKYLSDHNFRKNNDHLSHLSDKDVLKKVYTIAWPTTLEAVLVSLISMIDTIMIGGVGHLGISAIGVTVQPRMLILATIIALNISVTVLVSRRKGQKDEKGIKTVVTHSLVISSIIAFITSFIGFFFAQDILVFAGANQVYLVDAVAYFKVVMVGNFFYAISLTIGAIHKGLGNTKIAMRTNIWANLVNIVFNYLLIYGIWFFPRWEVAGDGVATMLGNFVAFGIAIYSLKTFKLHKQDFADFKKETVYTISRLAFYSGLEQIFIRIGFFIFAKQVFHLGPISSSSHQIAMNFMSLSFSLGDGLAIAATALIGHSLGAKEMDLANHYGRVTLRISRLLVICLSILILFFRIPLIKLFTSDANVIEVTNQLMFFLVFILFFQMSSVVQVGILRGAGDLKFVAWLFLISVAIIRPLLTYILAYELNKGVIGAWLAISFDQLVRSSASLIRYHHSEWMKIKL